MSDDASKKLPPCGLYRTTHAIGPVEAGKLVYFHNHGNPGAGVYLPKSWQGNRAIFHEGGHTLSKTADAQHLEPVPTEGFYRVREEFYCCDKHCRTFEPGLLVQLGYNADAEPILFEPVWEGAALALPVTGTRTELEKITHLDRLKVAAPKAHQPQGEAPSSGYLN